MTEWRALCEELAEDVRYLSECLRDPDSGVDPVCLSGAEADYHRARALLAQLEPEAVGLSEEDQHAVVGWHRHIRQRLQSKAAGLLLQRDGIAHPHRRIEAAQVGVEGGVAGGRVHSAVVEGAVEQQQPARSQGLPAAGQ